MANYSNSKIEQGVKQLLTFLGEDVKREGLIETPARYTRALSEMTQGYSKNPDEVLKCFEDGAEGCNQMVVQENIPVMSICEHHMLPFFGNCTIAYIPDQRIVGLSKLARVTDIFARRLQVQERLTNQIADILHNVLKPKGVGVVVRCRHLCMEYRGVRAPGTVTTTSALRGCILEEPASRAEFLQFVHK